MWLFTVVSLRTSRSAISLFDRPSRDKPEHFGFPGSEPVGELRRGLVVCGLTA